MYKYPNAKLINMKLIQILALLVVSVSPLSALGMYLDNPDYWISFDIIIIIIAPIIGLLIIKAKR